VEPIKFSHAQLSKTLGEPYQGLSGIALENLQSRLRGLFLMTLANQESALVVTTGNKSELAAGYCTIYGDMVGAIAPLGDLYKTQVFALSRYLTLQRKAPIPESTLRKPPSAELRPGQTDQDTLPTYENLDRALCGYLEEGRAVEDLIAEVVDPLERDKVRKFFSLFQISEFKRRQAAPVLRVSSKAFGWGRRVPIMGKKF
jgi:NAD+ synthase (glutamine-hydrolysing)